LNCLDYRKRSVVLRKDSTYMKLDSEKHGITKPLQL
ncbi:hypothetical protein T01_284, partial [Trichinella spiralis]